LVGLGVTKRDLIEDTYGHTKNFDDLLKSLASTSDDKESKKNKKKSSQQKSKITKDMEEKKKTDKSDPRKSKESRQVSRPHKKKFIQSKNVSNYTEAQLKEIFGV
jgi:phenylalanyl-tRNA synthetase alpha subunit